jgi:hypothetical protein
LKEEVAAFINLELDPIVIRISSIAILALLLAGCGGSGAPAERPGRPEWRALLERAAVRARADSVALAGSSVHAEGAMTLEFGRENEKVRVDDRLRLVKGRGREFLAEPLTHQVVGDTTLLKDMYTFKDSKGNTREQSSAQLSGLSFGAEFLPLLRALIAGADETGYTLRDSLADDGGVRCYLFSFATGERKGRFWIDRDSFGLRRMEVEQESSFIVGGYKYRMTTNFERRAGAGDSAQAMPELLLPVRTSTNFEYSRLASSGTGSVLVVLDSIHVP